MDYFTRAWALGELTDSEFDGALANYHDYIGSFDPNSSVRRFATAISLNDAWVDRFIFRPDQLSLTLLTGDIQRGYWSTEINYVGARIVLGEDALKQAVQHRPTEIWYDEFSGRPAHMVHRFLLVGPHGTEDRGEVHIEFEDLNFSETRADGRMLPSL
jgi:hypothetical protein